jgi:hypothetical protein
MPTFSTWPFLVLISHSNAVYAPRRRRTSYALTVQVEALQLQCSSQGINLLNVQLRSELVRWWAAAVASKECVATPHLRDTETKDDQGTPTAAAAAAAAAAATIAAAATTAAMVYAK